jgi:methyl-accepting chemotaxis protein
MIKRNVVVFSIIFFVVIAVGGTAAFFFAMGQIVRSDAVQKLSQTVSAKKFQLEVSAQEEIALAVKMADSPLIKRYFLNPDDPAVASLALEEIAGYRRAFSGDTVFWVNDVDRRFYNDDGSSFYVIDPSDPGSYWYNMTLYETEKFNFNINYNDQLKKTMLWINVPVFQDRKPIGMVGTGVILSDFVDALYTDLTPGVSFYLFNASFEITGAKDQSLVFDKKKLSDSLGGIGSLIMEEMKKLSSENIHVFNYNNTEYALCGIPSLNWYIVAMRPFTVSMYLNTSMTALFAAMMLVLVLVFVIFGGFIFTLLKPLINLEGTAAALADMDFTVDIGRIRTDEIGSIQRALIKIRDSLRKAMDDLNGHLSDVTANSERLNMVIVKSSGALGTITGNMDAMRSETDTQMESVSQASNAVGEIVKSIDSLNRAVQTQAAHITQSSAAIEQMVANIASIRSVVSGVSRTTDTLRKSSSDGHSMLIKLTEAVDHIQEQSATLQNANKTIADIAEQTNILAMNAAIEAAHAGETGKGFAVVAGEIRKLAELSGKESNAISEEIKKIERGIEQITGVSNQTVGAMDTIFTEIKAMDASFAQVNHAVEEQSAGGSQILTALKTIQEMTVQVRDGADTIHRQSGSIHEEMSTLRRISQNVTTRAHEVETASGNIASFLENAKDLHAKTA